MTILLNSKKNGKKGELTASTKEVYHCSGEVAE
jgi:hypothetical protein